MNKLLFSYIVSGFFVTMFLLGIIVCVVYILYVLSERAPQKGKTFMRFFSVRYFREVEGGELKKKVRVYRLSPEGARKTVQKKRKAAPRIKTNTYNTHEEYGYDPAYRTAQNRVTQNRAAQKKTPPKSASVSRRIYYINGKPSLEKPKETLRIKTNF